MESSSSQGPSSKMEGSSLFYVGLLSAILFLCPLIMIGVARIFAMDRMAFGLQDVLTIAGYWVAAGLVWMRFKFMWLVALSLLSLVVIANATSLVMNLSSDLGSMYVTQFILSVAAASAVVLTVEFINTQHFDRRDQFSILGAAERHLVSEPTTLRSEKGEKISGVTDSLSFSGAFFVADNIPASFYLKGWVIDIPGKGFIDQPVEIIEIDGKKMRIRFLNVNPIVMWKLNKQLKGSVKS